jgi:hypothetical protein
MNKRCWALIFATIAVATGSGAYAQDKAVVRQQESSWALNLYLPALQFRYDDDMEQQQSVKTSWQYTLAVRIFSDFLLGLETSSYAQKTGNSSLAIESSTQNFGINLGYRIVAFSMSNEAKLNFWGLAVWGQSRTQVTTQLLGTSSTEISQNKDIVGAGVIAQVCLKKFLIEFDTRLVRSDNFHPRTMSVSHVRLGIEVP